MKITTDWSLLVFFLFQVSMEEKDSSVSDQIPKSGGTSKTRPTKSRFCSVTKCRLVDFSYRSPHCSTLIHLVCSYWAHKKHSVTTMTSFSQWPTLDLSGIMVQCSGSTAVTGEGHRVKYNEALAPGHANLLVFTFLTAVCSVCGAQDGVTHPIQAAKVLHHVLVSVLVIVDHSMLFVHAARLQEKSKKESTT